jgi:di/tricarboxylate transporter
MAHYHHTLVCMHGLLHLQQWWCLDIEHGVGTCLQGGLVLSEAVKQSGVLAVAATSIEDSTKGWPLWSITATFCALVLFCTTFVSHTVGAMVILPVVATVGEHLPVAHPRLLIMASALMCSGAMGLPVSGALPVTHK